MRREGIFLFDGMVSVEPSVAIRCGGDFRGKFYRNVDFGLVGSAGGDTGGTVHE